MVYQPNILRKNVGLVTISPTYKTIMYEILN